MVINMEKLQIYKCSVCGNIIEVLNVGGGKLVCCEKPMELQIEGMTDGTLEKHVPVIEKKDNGYLIKIGAVPHPMVDKHYIEWIEIITNDKTYKKFLKPNDAPEAFFDNIKDDSFTVREYCNIHGLYKNEK